MRKLCSALFMLMLAGCGQPQVRAPRLSEADAIRIANKLVVDTGLPLSPQQAAATHASYDRKNTLWCLFYTLYSDRLPTGPIVCVNDRTGVAAFAPNM
jgi:hypothetical protein